MKNKLKIAGAIVAAGTLLAACSSSGSDSGSSDSAGSDRQYALITHSDGTDNFWPVAQKGAEDAAKKLGVGVEYTYSIDPLKESQLIDDAVAKKVDGIIVSLPNPDALKASVEKAVAAGIPVITMNSGGAVSKEFGALAHVGQDEKVAGNGAGERLKEAGVTNLLCVIHEAGNIALNDRCDGVAETLGGKVSNLQVNGANLTDVQSSVTAKLQADKSIDGIIALNPGVATAIEGAISSAGSDAKLATFDLSPDVIASVESGKILFAVDQQQYLQGYLPVVMLELYNNNQNTVGGGLPVLTGPGFVTKENAAKVADLTKAGTR